MIVRSAPVEIESLIFSPEQLQVRTEGVHVSSIIKHISKSLGQQDNTFSERDLNHFAVFGRVFEQLMTLTLFPSPRYERVGEIERDGIIGSPDAVDTVTWSVSEFKCCWQSSRDFENSPKFRMYLWQIMAYCYMLDTLSAELVVLFVCGNWRPPVPQITRYTLEFKWPEVQSNWEMLRRNVP